MLVSFDVETWLITDECPVPPLVCGAFSQDDSATLTDAYGTIAAIRHALASTTIVGANIAYDFSVVCNEDPSLVPLVFRAYREGRVYDVLLAQTLDAIAHGYLIDNAIIDPRGGLLRDSKGRNVKRYSLDTVVSLVLGRDDAKTQDHWRRRYYHLRNIPISEWPQEARDYPIADARNTLEVAIKQRQTLENLHDMPRQAFFAWCQRLGSIGGLRANSEAVERVIAGAEAELAANAERFQKFGVVRKDGSVCLAELKKLIVADIHGNCEQCRGNGKIASPKSGKSINCKLCDGTGKAVRTKCVDCNGVGGDDCHCTRGSVPTQAAQFVQFTETGGIARGADALYETGNELLIEYAVGTEKAKFPKTYGGPLRKAAQYPLFTPTNPILNNGRCSYGGVVQLFPREGGLRDCCEPRKGYLFASCDYEGLELATHAQSCLWLVGWSDLAEAINSGKKVHDLFGANMVGEDYEQFLAERKNGHKYFCDVRQTTKVVNFGLPGAMGAVKLVLQQRKQGPDTTGPDGRKWRGLRFCLLVGGETECGREKVTEWRGIHYSPVCKRCVECAEDLKRAWLKQWPENKQYFAWVKQQLEDPGYVIQHVSKRKRGGLNFPAAANTMFSGLAGDGSKEAFNRVTYEAFCDRSSALYGCRPLLFVHDEIICEVPIGHAHEAALRLSEVMVETMQEFTPDVQIKAEPCLMERWEKGAEPMCNEKGRLVPWRANK